MVKVVGSYAVGFDSWQVVAQAEKCRWAGNCKVAIFYIFLKLETFNPILKFTYLTASSSRCGVLAKAMQCCGQRKKSPVSETRQARRLTQQPSGQVAHSIWPTVRPTVRLPCDLFAVQPGQPPSDCQCLDRPSDGRRWPAFMSLPQFRLSSRRPPPPTFPPPSFSKVRVSFPCLRPDVGHHDRAPAPGQRAATFRLLSSQRRGTLTPPGGALPPARHGPEVPKIVFMAVGSETYGHAQSIPQFITSSVGSPPT